MGTHACELEDLSGQVLENGGDIDGSLGTNAHLVLGVLLEETLDTTAGELFRHVSDLVVWRGTKQQQRPLSSRLCLVCR
jgi:hypothetical protein